MEESPSRGAEGRTKKEAEQAAAREALEQLRLRRRTAPTITPRNLRKVGRVRTCLTGQRSAKTRVPQIHGLGDTLRKDS